MKGLKIAALVTTAGAMLVVPTVGQADRPDAQGNHNHPNGQAETRTCTNKPTVNKGFVVRGILDSSPPPAFTADTLGTETNEANIRIDVLGANRHARRAGVEKGETYTADGTPGSPPGNDQFKVQLSGYEGTDTPSVGDKVRAIGKVPVQRARCFPNLSLTQRYGDENLRKVKIIDQDPDTP